MSDVEWARLEDAPVKEKFGGTIRVPCSFSILRVKLQPPKGAKDAKSRLAG
jgi:hypothetical protein